MRIEMLPEEPKVRRRSNMERPISQMNSRAFDFDHASASRASEKKSGPPKLPDFSASA